LGDRACYENLDHIGSNELAAYMISTSRLAQRLNRAGMQQRQADAVALVLYETFQQHETQIGCWNATTSDLKTGLERAKVLLVAWQIVSALGLIVVLTLSHTF
jgi:hypothetical protein